ncbi:MAG: cellulase family glycosylhydrolase [Candidatus Binatia bacterium]
MKLPAFALALAALVAAASRSDAQEVRRPVRVADALCVSQSDGPFLTLAPEARDAYLSALADAGWKLMRIDFTWSRIQPGAPPAALDFSRYDDLVDRAAAHDVKLLGILDYGVDWAASAAPAGDDRYPPDDPAAFAAFAGQLAKRYRKRVPAWEVWNEPNNGLSGFWKPTPDPAVYARLAMTAARALRRADPKATIVTGGLAPTLDLITYGRDYGFFTAATQAEKKWHRKFKAAAVHPYTFLQAPAPEADDTTTPGLLSVVHQIRDFRDRLTESNATRLPVWLTELGWHTAPESGVAGFPPGVSEIDQARYLVRAVTLALSQRAERVCWYTLLDYPAFLTNKEDAFGLFRYQANPTPGTLDPKPAYTAAKTLAGVLGPTRFVRDLRVELDLPREGYAFCFQSTKPRQTIIVFWATAEGVTSGQAVAPDVIGIRRVEMDGTETDLGLPDRVDVTLGPTPFYLIFDQK